MRNSSPEVCIHMVHSFHARFHQKLLTMPPCHSCTHLFRYTHIFIFIYTFAIIYNHIYNHTHICFIWTNKCTHLYVYNFLCAINTHNKIHVNLNEGQRQLTCYMSTGPRSQLFEPCRSWRVAGSVRYSQSFAAPIPMPVIFASHHGRQEPG